MKVCGYAINDLEADLPLELRELTLSLTADEIDLVIAFLQNAKTRFETCSPTPGQSHVHLRDWWRGWSKTTPDLIVVFEELKPQTGTP